jgi:hypothetical protein
LLLPGMDGERTKDLARECVCQLWAGEDSDCEAAYIPSTGDLELPFIWQRRVHDNLARESKRKRRLVRKDKQAHTVPFERWIT